MYKLHYIGCIPMERQYYVTIVKENAALGRWGARVREKGEEGKEGRKRRDLEDELVEKRISDFVFTQVPKLW